MLYSPLATVATSVLLVSQALAHQAVYHQESGSPDPFASNSKRPVLSKDSYVPSFSGISTFAHLPYVQCWEENVPDDYDIAVMGVPYDIGVTFRTGARFGPSSIREGSKRTKGWNSEIGINPFKSWAKLVDCGDIPFTPFDSLQAIEQIEQYTKYVLNRPMVPGQLEPKIPQLITLGGDHTVLLPVLRAMAEAHGRPINVIHFDSHLDTWSPEAYGIKPPSVFNHGNPLYHAAKEGLIANGTSMHVGIRSSLYESDDFEKDEALGFRIIKANDIFDIGVDGIIARMHEFLGPKEDAMVYLSIDIDVIDPSAAPGTGTLESGGFMVREMRRIIRSLRDYHLVGADVVEVCPPYDNPAQITSITAADLLYEIISMMVKKEADNRSD
ncbi:hypothetical protein INT43_008239 [Umbelopsis isabellina]|uniref:Agmatinase n=1 Tax=Mortierella isabellina TaxID=91625 RepID=A0A8H7PCV3_MORIS|nr:hypothetical protein INT43_008239 [Umbelopsis isabellina]